MGGTPVTPLLPSRSITECISSCYSSHLQTVRNISSLIPCWFSVNSRCQSHAPSLQTACLYTCSSLQQTYVTFNSNYMFIVAKPQNLGIFLAQYCLQKQSKTWHVQNFSLAEIPHFTWEKELAWICFNRSLNFHILSSSKLLINEKLLLKVLCLQGRPPVRYPVHLIPK